eukprot:CAMPEP_0177252412 /NCGR_PEP_ID=MMETSP0367-20130122/54533_1 /TAXON_ID=447022 ORGANISM="Scrippsiella hangoei-like, Strain SHHI-4" /NCGR_SAMPLE_ID=MMETSP0367 /ASSEMBLY_ACC=CAM_ASM_000362 /LENGTH=53 /DNA_ID=CAMNT_0018705505 /DNA_START=90 /DNA_END=248 /DNA_ORIENTATION=-
MPDRLLILIQSKVHLQECQPSGLTSSAPTGLHGRKCPETLHRSPDPPHRTPAR